MSSFFKDKICHSYDIMVTCMVLVDTFIKKLNGFGSSLVT